MCETILWKTFSPLSNKSNYLEGNEYEGSFINLIHSLITHSDKTGALANAFFR